MRKWFYWAMGHADGPNWEELRRMMREWLALSHEARACDVGDHVRHDYATGGGRPTEIVDKSGRYYDWTREVMPPAPAREGRGPEGGRPC